MDLFIFFSRLLLTVTVFIEAADEIQKDESFFLDEIFKKYGDDGFLTFEGFEHLMENLGLGKLRFEKNHTVWVHKTADGRFKEVHDKMNLHEHNHSNETGRVMNRQKRNSETKKESGTKVLECLTPQDILLAYGMEPNHEVAISPLHFVHICPAIVFQLDQKVCSLFPQASLRKVPPPTAQVAWLYGSLSILVISVCGLLGVSIVPLLEKTFFNNLLGTLVALAVGTLCGDALLHLLPHALESDDGDHGVLVLKSSTTFLTVLFFFLLEAFIHGGHGHSHGTEEIAPPTQYSMVTIGDNDGPNEKKESKDKKKGSTVGRLVVIGDGLHNLTDGLAIGAAFRGDPAAGLATAIAVLTHELPHELGDFAVLLKTGMTVRKALYYNILSSVLSYVGMAFGIYIGNLHGASQWVYAATAGSFLYIALADLVPELHKYRGGGGIRPLFLQILGVFGGGILMFLIAIYEDSLYSLLKESDV